MVDFPSERKLHSGWLVSYSQLYPQRVFEQMFIACLLWTRTLKTVSLPSFIPRDRQARKWGSGSCAGEGQRPRQGGQQGGHTGLQWNLMTILQWPEVWLAPSCVFTLRLMSPFIPLLTFVGYCLFFILIRSFMSCLGDSQVKINTYKTKHIKYLSVSSCQE